ncbi:hypothetical protein chiPu_0008821 [Chiloscyllium punctatum]|uniref:Uncharacterized protein n=1 Tax=Chiloscyllium punctatum TaxID=137246 RepID=A0A401SJ52_CHIPU|nr:hypothetical protein [Chiloscyllium punctatum]
MPFCKRIVRPVQLCRLSGEDRRLSALENLIDVSSFTLGSVLRQLSALAREAVSVLEEIELEIGSISHRALLLEVRIIGLHRYVSALALRPAVPCEYQRATSVQFLQSNEGWGRDLLEKSFVKLLFVDLRRRKIHVSMLSAMLLCPILERFVVISHYRTDT